MQRLTLFLATCATLVGISASRAQESRPANALERQRVALGFTQVAGGAWHRVVTVPGTGHTALVVSLAFGQRAREPVAALATALGIALTNGGDAKDAAAKPEAWQVRVVEGAIQIASVVPSSGAEAALGRVLDLVGGKDPLTDEALVVATSRARLLADDAVHVLPGPALQARARHELGLGAPLSGVPEAFDFPPERVRTTLRDLARSENLSLVVLAGDEARPLVGSFAAWSRAHAGAAALPADPARASTPQPEVREHDRVDAPFVAVAFPAPAAGDERIVPFLVAIEILRARAASVFAAYRGAESAARFPFVAFDPWEGSPLVAVQRRGKNGDTVEDTRREMRAFLQRVRTELVQPEEVALAGVALCRTLWLPPYDSGVDLLVKQPRLMLNRAVTLAAAFVQRWPSDLTTLVQRVDTMVVRDILARALDPDRLVWSCLAPAPGQKR